MKEHVYWLISKSIISFNSCFIPSLSVFDAFRVCTSQVWRGVVCSAICPQTPACREMVHVSVPVFSLDQNNGIDHFLWVIMHSHGLKQNLSFLKNKLWHFTDWHSEHWGSIFFHCCMTIKWQMIEVYLKSEAFGLYLFSTPQYFQVNCQRPLLLLPLVFSQQRHF